MAKVREKFIVNDRGKQVAVVLDIAEYRQILSALEELESIKAYDAAKASQDEAVPFEVAIAEIERERH